MKNLFKKAVSLTIALSTVAALSVSAFATPVATPSESKDAVTVTGYETVGPGQYAVAVVEKTFLGSGTEEDNAKIYYVNQAADTGEVNINTILANMLLKEELAPGNYEVRIGTNATIEAGEHPAYTCIDLVVPNPSTGDEDDFITSADTTKGIFKTDVASVTHNTMGLAKGNAIVSLTLNPTAYPNAGNSTPGYIVAVVDNTTGNYVGTVYYSAERAKYIALIPIAVTDYKFEVLTTGDTNAVITKYGNMNEDADGKLTQTVDFRDFKRAYLAGANSPALSDAKKALIADVTGDGKLATKDFREFKKAYLNQSYTFDVLTLNN